MQGKAQEGMSNYIWCFPPKSICNKNSCNHCMMLNDNGNGLSYHNYVKMINQKDLTRKRVETPFVI